MANINIHAVYTVLEWSFVSVNYIFEFTYSFFLEKFSKKEKKTYLVNEEQLLKKS